MIGPDSGDVRQLRARLDLDSGYLSRLLRSRERGTIRHAARAIYQARVPQAELIVRRVYGVAGAGMINRHRVGRAGRGHPATGVRFPCRVASRPRSAPRSRGAAEPEAAVEPIRPTLAVVTSPFRTAERFGVQDIIDPRDSRPLLCDWVRDAYRVLPELTGTPSSGTRPRPHQPPTAPAPDRKVGALPVSAGDRKRAWGR